MLTLDELREFCRRQEEVDEYIHTNLNRLYRLREDWQDACCSKKMPPVASWELCGDEILGSFESFAYGDYWSEHFSFPAAWLFFGDLELGIIVEQHLEEERQRKESQKRAARVKETQQRIAQLEKELEALRDE